MHPDIGVLHSGKCYVFLDGYGREYVAPGLKQGSELQGLGVTW